MAQAVLAGDLPATPAITNFVHVDDAVYALARSLDWLDGVYHVVDDEPAPGTEWVPAFARELGAPEPRMEEAPVGAPRGRAVSNAKAHAAGWQPAHRSWRQGFLHP